MDHLDPESSEIQARSSLQSMQGCVEGNCQMEASDKSMNDLQGMSVQILYFGIPANCCLLGFHPSHLSILDDTQLF